MVGPDLRVDVVLDCVHEERAGETFERVFVRGVFTPGEAHPPQFEGAVRNVVQTWLGVPSDQRCTAAFAILVEVPPREPHLPGRPAV